MTDRNTYDDFAEQYSAMVSNVDLSSDPVLSVFLDVVGDVQWLRVLDEGCGDGPVAGLLASRGAEVCAVDISAPLVELGLRVKITVVCWLKKILLTTPYQSFANRAKLVVEGIENHTKSRNQQTTVILRIQNFKARATCVVLSKRLFTHLSLIIIFGG